MLSTRLMGSVGALIALLLLGAGCERTVARSAGPDVSAAASTAPVPPPALPPAAPHVPIPGEVRAIYWTAQTAATPRADELLAYIKQHKLNAAVIDLKMDDGGLAFLPKDPVLSSYRRATYGIKDLDALMAKLHEAGIYRIARVAVMRDGAFASVVPTSTVRLAGGGVWRDKIGSVWVDPAAPEVADYAIALGREAFKRGFDEIQYDYVRYPSDGNLSAIVYPITGRTSKIEGMKKFFARVGGTMRGEGIPVSFDVFGMTFWLAHDYNIGQRLIDAYPYADFISPMPYPSHYPNGFKGFANPAAHPYEIIKLTLDAGADQLARELQAAPTSSRPKFRPWIQDFDLGATYTPAMIEAEIKAVRDAGGSGYMIWNARNVYRSAAYAPK